MKEAFKAFCKFHKLKFERVEKDKYIASKICSKKAGNKEGFKNWQTIKTRKFFTFNNTSKNKLDFSQIPNGISINKL